MTEVEFTDKHTPVIQVLDRVVVAQTLSLSRVIGSEFIPPHHIVEILDSGCY
jgi:hypothetical protein